jgi:hypothetical protein
MYRKPFFHTSLISPFNSYEGFLVASVLSICLQEGSFVHSVVQVFVGGLIVHSVVQLFVGGLIYKDEVNIK